MASVRILVAGVLDKAYEEVTSSAWNLATQDIDD